MCFNQEYTSEVQKKWKPQQDVIKKLKEKNIKAQSSAQLKLFLDSGMKTLDVLTVCARGDEDSRSRGRDSESSQRMKETNMYLH